MTLDRKSFGWRTEAVFPTEIEYECNESVPATEQIDLCLVFNSSEFLSSFAPARCVTSADPTRLEVATTKRMPFPSLKLIFSLWLWTRH